MKVSLSLLFSTVDAFCVFRYFCLLMVTVSFFYAFFLDFFFFSGKFRATIHFKVDFRVLCEIGVKGHPPPHWYIHFSQQELLKRLSLLLKYLDTFDKNQLITNVWVPLDFVLSYKLIYLSLSQCHTVFISDLYKIFWNLEI